MDFLCLHIKEITSINNTPLKSVDITVQFDISIRYVKKLRFIILIIALIYLLLLYIIILIFLNINFPVFSRWREEQLKIRSGDVAKGLRLRITQKALTKKIEDEHGLSFVNDKNNNLLALVFKLCLIMSFNYLNYCLIYM